MKKLRRFLFAFFIKKHLIITFHVSLFKLKDAIRISPNCNYIAINQNGEITLATHDETERLIVLKTSRPIDIGFLDGATDFATTFSKTNSIFYILKKLAKHHLATFFWIKTVSLHFIFDSAHTEKIISLSQKDARTLWKFIYPYLQSSHLLQLRVMEEETIPVVSMSNKFKEKTIYAGGQAYTAAKSSQL